MSNLLESITRKIRDTSETPALDAQILLAQMTGLDRSYIIAHPEIQLTGQFAESDEQANVGEVIQVIEAAYDEEQERLRRLQEAS